jgi:hypothetical protein
MRSRINFFGEKFMTHKKLILAATAAGALVSASALAGDPSAKFAATYTETPSLSTSAMATCSTTDGGTTINGNCTADVDEMMGHTLARMKVPQDKELLVGVSAEIGLMTFGAVKGKNGGSATAVADAEAYVSLEACPVGGGDCVDAVPSSVKLSKRVQELSAKLGGVIKDCTFGDTGTVQDISAVCNLTDEEIALALTTTASHHFNFVFPNMNQGVYDIKATFGTASDADVTLCDYSYTGATYITQDCDDDGSVAATAEAASIINKTMVTVQQVRAAKNGIVDVCDLDDGCPAGPNP